MYSFDMSNGMLWISALIGYALGNISPATLLGRAKNIDIKKEGSGNAGTTNVLRTLGKKAAVITLIVDVLKGALAVIIASFMAGDNGSAICVLSVVVGHIWPVLYGFKGGKGVATAFGALTAFNAVLGCSALAIVAVGIAFTRRMSVGAILACISFPALAYFIEAKFVAIGTLLAAVILYKHRGNIRRLLEGNEPKIGERNA